METSVLKQLKKKADSLITPAFLQSGRVLEVRTWQPATFIEIDLHLPNADMLRAEIPYIKIKVDDFTFRDYTPSGWDAETRTCTLFIDAAHCGPGSRWAAGLKKNDLVQYLKIDYTHHVPHPTNLVAGLGDESSMGHLLALQQMVLPVTRFTGAIILAEETHRASFKEYFRSPIQAICRQDMIGNESLMQWTSAQGFCAQHTVFYLVGNNLMVSKLKRSLKEQGFLSAQIKVKGFWD